MAAWLKSIESDPIDCDARYGVMTSLTGPNSLTTNWLYDDFGRQTKELRVDGTSTTITRSWCNSLSSPSCPTRYSLAKKTQSTGSGAVTEYSDRLGRVIQINSSGSIKGSDNHGSHNTSFSQTHYNAKGQVQQKLHPIYYDAVTPQSQVWIWTYFKYDVLGRLTEEIDNNGQKTIYTHNGFTTQVTNKLNQTTTRITNARGELVHEHKRGQVLHFAITPLSSRIYSTKNITYVPSLTPRIRRSPLSHHFSRRSQRGYL